MFFLEKCLHTSPMKYEDSKNNFEKNCQNMLVYLKYYNLNDVRLLEKGKDNKILIDSR